MKAYPSHTPTLSTNLVSRHLGLSLVWSISLCCVVLSPTKRVMIQTNSTFYLPGAHMPVAKWNRQLRRGAIRRRSLTRTRPPPVVYSGIVYGSVPPAIETRAYSQHLLTFCFAFLLSLSFAHTGKQSKARSRFRPTMARREYFAVHPIGR